MWNKDNLVPSKDKDQFIPNKEAGKRQTQIISPILSKPGSRPKSHETTPSGTIHFFWSYIYR
jgi:hypothetical protein